MSIWVKVINTETDSVVDMEIAPDNCIDEIIESAVHYWEIEPNAYVLRKGRLLLRGQMKVTDAGLNHRDTLELIPDPEGYRELQGPE